MVIVVGVAHRPQRPDEGSKKIAGDAKPEVFLGLDGDTICSLTHDEGYMKTTEDPNQRGTSAQMRALGSPFISKRMLKGRTLA